MGTDCRMIAKKTDGTIITRSLDRWYVFDSDFLSDDSFATAFPDGKFKLEQGIEWCIYRLTLMICANEKSLKTLPHDWKYHMYWIADLLQALTRIQMYSCEWEWIGVYDEHCNIYSEFITYFDGVKKEI